MAYLDDIVHQIVLTGPDIWFNLWLGAQKMSRKEFSENLKVELTKHFHSDCD